MTNGLLLKNRRLELGLTQDDLAKKAGVSRSTIVRMERGDDASFIGPVRRALADALELDAEAFSGDDQ